MRRETTESAEAPIRLMEFVRSFHLGGTEGQVVELLRSLPPTYRVQLAVMNFVGPLSEAVMGQVSMCRKEPSGQPLRMTVPRSDRRQHRQLVVSAPLSLLGGAGSCSEV